MRDFRAAPPGPGSVIAVVATDAPFFPSQCKALARRVTLGLARTGTSGSHSSGDIFLAVSTANPGGFSGEGPEEPQDRTPAAYDTLDVHPVGQARPVLRGRRPGHRRGRGQRPHRQRGHDRPRRPPFARPAAPPPGRDPVPQEARLTIMLNLY